MVLQARRRAFLLLIGLLVAVLGVLGWSLSAGSMPVSGADLLTALQGGEGGMEVDIVRNLRLPRAIATGMDHGLAHRFQYGLRARKAFVRAAHHEGQRARVRRRDTAGNRRIDSDIALGGGFSAQRLGGGYIDGGTVDIAKRAI